MDLTEWIATFLVIWFIDIQWNDIFNTNSEKISLLKCIQ